MENNITDNTDNTDNIKLDDFELDNIRHSMDNELDNEFYENELITEQALYYPYNY